MGIGQITLFTGVMNFEEESCPVAYYPDHG